MNGNVNVSARTRSSRRGSAAAELAVWMPLLMIMLSGLIDFSWWMSRYQNVVRVARDSARVAAATYQNPLDDDYGDGIETAALDHAYRALEMMRMPCDPEVCVITPRFFVGPAGVEFVQVEVRYQYTPLVGLYPFSGNLRSAFTMAYEFQG